MTGLLQSYTNMTGQETSQTCSLMSPFSEEEPVSVQPVHMYSYCILNYQDSGFYGTLMFLSDLVVLIAKRIKRIPNITLCTYGLKHFKGYNKVQMYII